MENEPKHMLRLNDLNEDVKLVKVKIKCHVDSNGLCAHRKLHVIYSSHFVRNSLFCRSHIGEASQSLVDLVWSYDAKANMNCPSKQRG